ncbi:LpxI family protein [Persephonella atlantica]|uniref:LpxI family protein n=1 Tax=Persephonella atlantica TaxID=2699429 RepID=A0ABS1GJA4_9AQUI|nr:UDP-2,3-diacylglucosamine diphosphatase LpxI [Persephonella atlantica]MBK3332916.1 LpxI family protein [Persephonella atlantica]
MKKIGLIAGAGELPVEFAKSAWEKNENLIVYGIKGITDKKIQSIAPTKWLYLGQAQKLIDTMRQDQITDVVMLGKIEHYHLLTSIHRFDRRAREFFSSLIDKRAKSILEAVLKELEKEGFCPIDPSPYLSSLLAPEGVIAGENPPQHLMEDALFGLKIAKEIAQLDIGQTVVVKDKIVIAVEGLEGTDKCIIRGGELGGEGTVVCKVARKNQDMRYDVPVIGVKTLKSMKKAKAKLLAVEAGKTFVLENNQLKKLASKSGISIVGVKID